MTDRQSGHYALTQGNQGTRHAYDDEQRDTEARKLDALTAISVSIGVLGHSLTAIVTQGQDQGRKLDSMDRKLDKLLDMAVARNGS